MTMRNNTPPPAAADAGSPALRQLRMQAECANLQAVMTDLSLCPCGSGLRKLRCCALDLAGLSPRDASAPLQTLVEQADAAADNDSAAAIALCCQVLELAPGQEQALALLYRLRKAEPRPAAAGR